MERRRYSDQIRKVMKENVIDFHGDIALFPFGKRGKLVKNILNSEFDIQETYIIDNFCLSSETITFNEFAKIKDTECLILLCTDINDIKEKMKQDVSDLKINSVIDVFPEGIKYCEGWIPDDILEDIYIQIEKLVMSDEQSIYELLGDVEEKLLADNFEDYLEIKGLDTRLRRAYSLTAYLLKRKCVINQKDILAGNASYRRNNRTYPQNFSEELEDILSKGIINSERKEMVLSAEKMGLFFRVSGGHVVPNYAKLLNCGIDALLQEIRNRYKSAIDKDKLLFYKAEIIVIRALQETILKYAQSAIKEERDDIYNACINIAHKKPESFFEAVQLFWIQHEVMVLEGNIKGISLGRVDQFLYPFYAKDLEKGCLDSEKTLKILCDLWEKFEFDRGALAFQNVTLGGLTDDKTDGSNELTLLCLEAQNIVRHNQPMLSLRTNEYTNNKVWDKALEVIGSGMGVPALFNDNIVIEAKKNAGIDQRDAYNYAIVGCVEPSVSGMEYSHTEGLRINWCKILELMLFGGNCPVTNNKWKLKKYEQLETIKDFNYFYNWYKSELIQAIECGCETIAIADELYGKKWPAPYLSLLMDGCLESGIDVTCGGTKYNNLSVNFAGMANTVNSLYVIKELVFEKQKVKLEDLPMILYSDYENCDKLLEQIIDMPKYGNDDDIIDKMMTELIDLSVSTIRKYKCKRGGLFQAGFYTVILHSEMGKKMVATPDGRRKGWALASSLSPTQGTDTHGVLAVLNSVTKLPLNKMGNGMVLDVKFSPNVFEDYYQRQKIREVIKAYFENGGHEIQINVVNKDTLMQAQRHPDEYKTLMVRVSGFSTYFTALDKTLQDEIILRYENKSV